LNQNIPDNSKKPKSSFKGFAITSLVIGILVVVTTFVAFLLEWGYMWSMSGSLLPEGFYYFITLVSFVGFICGVIGLWSIKRKRAIIGIILCSLVFALLILLPQTY
jgi:hypothetical protein